MTTLSDSPFSVAASHPLLLFLPPPHGEAIEGVGELSHHHILLLVLRRQSPSLNLAAVAAMSFSGTQDKCKACGKTVHFIDLLTADGVPFHKTCFKCSHCRSTLSMCNYSSMDGVLYCKPHFEQLFKETGSFTKKFHSPSKSAEKLELNRTSSKVSQMFSGTLDKCAVCKKTVYPLEKISVEGDSYHKTCFKCSHGGCTLTPSSYAALDGILYCKHHFAQLFMEKGSYNHLIKAASMKKEEMGAATAKETTHPEQAAEEEPHKQQKELS